MDDAWEKTLACALRCERCGCSLSGGNERILSVYDHAPICMDCKGKEEQRDDYEKVAKQMIGTCMADAELLYGDAGGYCYHHFYPFKC